MENVYFIVKPSDFWRFGEVDINGDYPRYFLNDFNVYPEFNYLIFKGSCKDKGEMIEYPHVVRELFTGKKFDLEMKRNQETGEKEIRLYSDELGIYQNKPKKLKSAECSCSKISGMIKYMKRDEEIGYTYLKSIKDTFAESKYFAKEYDKTIMGPKKSLIQSFKNFSNKIR